MLGELYPQRQGDTSTVFMFYIYVGYIMNKSRSSDPEAGEKMGGPWAAASPLCLPCLLWPLVFENLMTLSTSHSTLSLTVDFESHSVLDLPLGFPCCGQLQHGHH